MPGPAGSQFRGRGGIVIQTHEGNVARVCNLLFEQALRTAASLGSWYFDGIRSLKLPRRPPTITQKSASHVGEPDYHCSAGTFAGSFVTETAAAPSIARQGRVRNADGLRLRKHAHIHT